MYLRYGQTAELRANWPSFDDPYYVPKTLGISAFYGALIVGTIMIPVGILVPNPIVAIAIIAALWLLLIVAQAIGWYRYFFRVRPAQARAALAKLEAEAASVRLAELKAKNTAENEARKTALAEYQLAFQEGQQVIEALRSRAGSLGDQKRVVRAIQEFGKAQRSGSDEPDLATRFIRQAEAMRREARHIKTITFSF